MDQRVIHLKCITLQGDCISIVATIKSSTIQDFRYDDFSAVLFHIPGTMNYWTLFNFGHQAKFQQQCDH